ncbi:hypothetical protein [Sulfitobacter sp. SK011]|uniref:hypothetical protein n=1 Tax=Sulfitobacter sp. SK011 TaxID=1389004 RepID=UPI000E0B9F03|nr:hypothetical protein [Sulfitobacter sp. SK011]AXI43277.1 hypothetical protein C1J02_16065 [Sulfitobacter sp. SK011]MDA1044808.1 hypothetical protein [Verrucomicrobiota bacterium]
MTRKTHTTPLTEFDLMVIRAGGRTQAELEAMAQGGFGFGVRCMVCAFLADTLYRVVVKLETGANRATEASHHRLTANPAA